MSNQRLPVSIVITAAVLLVCSLGSACFFCKPLELNSGALPQIAPVPLEPALFYRNCYAALDIALTEQLQPPGLELHEVGTHPLQRDGISLWPQKIIEIAVPEGLAQPVIIQAVQKAVEPFKPVVTCEALPGAVASYFSITIAISRIPSHKLIFFSYTTANPSLKTNGRAAIIIDDIGNNYSLSLDALGIKTALTISILPFSPYAQVIAGKARSSGHEIMLHLPMEAKNGVAGSLDYPERQNVLFIEMQDEDIRNRIIKSIAALPYCAGINNHMGSRFTENRDKMEIVLEQIKEQRLFYIDSVTSEQSIGYEVAKSMGIKTARRDIFLDNEESYLSTVNKLEQLLQLAISRGTAIGIGHPYPSTLHAINTMLPEFEKMGVAIVPASMLMQ